MFSVKVTLSMSVHKVSESIRMIGRREKPHLGPFS